MAKRAERADPETGDLFDELPALGRATTQLERSLGPSCLLSLIIVVLILLVLKRVTRVPWAVFLCIAVLIWVAVLTLLVRWRPDRVVDEDE